MGVAAALGECSSSASSAGAPTVLEFFAGIGLARIGLERAGFRVAWSNDYEPGKHRLYRDHFRDGEGAGEPSGHGDSAHVAHRSHLGDVADVHVADLPRAPALAWASSPCTDLSLAGARAGLNGTESSAFWHVTRLLDDLGAERPPVVVLENVVGLATSHAGRDLAAAVRAFNDLGYCVDVLALDARRFVPQSRPRLFAVAILDGLLASCARAGASDGDARTSAPPTGLGIGLATDTAHGRNSVSASDDDAVPAPSSDAVLRPPWLDAVHADPELRTHRATLPMPPALLTTGLGDVVEGLADDDARWWDADRTAAFLGSLSDVQRARVDAWQDADVVRHRTAYRRTREGVARWEVRADDVAGCLRTARGGSSRQALLRIGGGRVRLRWMTSIELARLMGAAEYTLDGVRDSQALFGFGDAVAVPVVEWLARHYLMPAYRGQITI